MANKKIVQTTGTILDKLEGRTLTNIVLDRKYLEGYDEETLPEALRNTRIFPKEACLREIKKDMAIQIINQFIQHLTQKELIRWTKGVIPKNVLSTKKVNNPTSMNVMKKRLKEHVEAAGLRGYIKQRRPSSELLWKTLKSLNPWLFNKENPASKDIPLDDGAALLKLIYEQLNILALEYILFELSIKTLQQMVEDSELNIKTQSKPMLVRNLVEMKDYKPKPVNIPRRTKAPEEEKKPKKKGLGRIRLSNILVIFTDDEDDEPWNDATYKKALKREVEISIDSENDADKHPPKRYESSLSITFSDSDSEFDAKAQRKYERELRREERKKRKEMKMKAKSKKERKYESFTESSSGDSDGKKKKKSRKTKREDKENKKDGKKSQNEEPKNTEKDEDEADEDKSVPSGSKKPKKVTEPETTEQGKKTKGDDPEEEAPPPKTSSNKNKKDRSETGDENQNSLQHKSKKSRKSNTSNEEEGSEKENDNELKNKKPTTNPPKNATKTKNQDPPPQEDLEESHTSKNGSKKPIAESDTNIKKKTDPKPSRKITKEEDVSEESSSPAVRNPKDKQKVQRKSKA